MDLSIDEFVSNLTIMDSIIENLGGSAIYIKSTNKTNKSNLKLKGARSDILSKFGSPYVLELDGICCTDVIFTSKVRVCAVCSGNNNDNNDNDNNTVNCIRYSRYEEGSSFEKSFEQDKHKIVIDLKYKCTSDRPIFTSTNFGDSMYLHLDSFTSKKILEGGENDLEMGVFNKNAYPLKMRRLQLRLSEFMPLESKAV